MRFAISATRTSMKSLLVRTKQRSAVTGGRTFPGNTGAITLGVSRFDESSRPTSTQSNPCTTSCRFLSASYGSHVCFSLSFAACSMGGSRADVCKGLVGRARAALWRLAPRSIRREPASRLQQQRAKRTTKLPLTSASEHSIGAPCGERVGVGSSTIDHAARIDRVISRLLDCELANGFARTRSPISSLRLSIRGRGESAA